MDESDARYAPTQLGRTDWRVYDRDEFHVVRETRGNDAHPLSFESQAEAQECADAWNRAHERRAALAKNAAMTAALKY